MIVISGALVLVALVLLVLGLTMTDLNFVYGSIAVSLISFVFLVIGILQRRGEQPGTPASGGTEVTDDAPAAEPAAVPAKTGGAGPVPVPAQAEDAYVDDEYDDLLAGATVLVVPGRPRYHVEGCRYLTGKAAEEVDLESARQQYTACGVCKPDAALAELESAPEVQVDAYDADEEDVVDSGVPGAEDADADLQPEPVAPRRRAATSRSGSTRVSSSRTSSASSSGRASTRAASKRTAKAVVEPPAAEVPVEAAAPAAPAAPAKAAGARRTGRVVVIPDRPKYHLAQCRFVRDALGTEEMTRTQATKQGFSACGVCKP